MLVMWLALILSWMVGTVAGDFHQNIFPLIMKLFCHTSIVLCHQSTNMAQFVKCRSVQPNYEIIKWTVQYDMWQNRVPVTELTPVVDWLCQVANVWVWNVLLGRMWRQTVSRKVTVDFIHHALFTSLPLFKQHLATTNQHTVIMKPNQTALTILTSTTHHYDDFSLFLQSKVTYSCMALNHTQL